MYALVKDSIHGMKTFRQGRNLYSVRKRKGIREGTDKDAPSREPSKNRIRGAIKKRGSASKGKEKSSLKIEKHWPETAVLNRPYG